MDNRKRVRTAYPGVYYRERPDGSRQHIIGYTGTDGRHRWQNTPGGLKDAVKARAKIINDMAHGLKVEPSKVLFSDFAREWINQQTNLAPRSIAAYRGMIELHLIPRLGQRIKLSDVDVNRVARLIESMQREEYSANSIRCALKPLSRIMATATRRGMVMVNPVTQLDRSERPRGDAGPINILDSHEIEAMLNHAGEHRTLLATLVFTGVRLGELLALRWEDVDWGSGILHVHGTKTSSSEREVVLMPALQQLLAQRSLEPRANLIFPISRNGVRYAVRQALRKAGVQKHIRIHDLRHTYASLMISEGHDINYIAGQMGHANSYMTLKYGHLIDRKKKRDEAKERMEQSFSQLLGVSPGVNAGSSDRTEPEDE